MFRETVFGWEQARKKSLLESDLDNARAAQAEMLRAFEATGMILTAANIPQYFAPARMGHEMIRQIALTDETSLADHVTDEDFDEIKTFVANLFADDFSASGTSSRGGGDFPDPGAHGHSAADADLFSDGRTEEVPGDTQWCSTG